MRSICVLNQSSRDSVEAFLQKALSDWTARFFTTASEVTVEFNEHLFATKKVADEDCVFELAKGHILVASYTETFNDLAESALATPATDDKKDKNFWDQLKQYLVSDLLGSLSGQRETANTLVKVEDKESFSSLAGVNVSIDGKTLSLDVDFGLIEALGLYSPSESAKQPNKLYRREDIPSKQKVKLHAKLQDISLSLQELIDLKVGDIVPINHLLQAPLILKTEDGTVPIKSFLVKQNTNKAFMVGK